MVVVRSLELGVVVFVDRREPHVRAGIAQEGSPRMGEGRRTADWLFKCQNCVRLLTYRRWR